MQTQIWYSNEWAPVLKKEMSSAELYQERQRIQKNLLKTFNWKDYQKWLNHLVYYAEINDTAYVYPNGYLMDEKEFDNLACRTDVKFVGAWHRH